MSEDVSDLGPGGGHVELSEFRLPDDALFERIVHVYVVPGSAARGEGAVAAVVDVAHVGGDHQALGYRNAAAGPEGAVPVASDEAAAGALGHVVVVPVAQVIGHIQELTPDIGLLDLKQLHAGLGLVGPDLVVRALDEFL